MSNNNDNSNNIYFIVEEPITEEVTTTIESERGGERDGRRDTGGGWGATEPRRSRFDAIQQIREQTVKRSRVSVKSDKLKSQMQELVATVNDLFDTTEPNPIVEPAHGLQLEEITLSVQVNAKGELSILGTGGEIGGSGGITLKFARPKQ
ncbi:MAG: hypothetical protein HLUCCA11_16895 [Phormidesmis priestleyi Ana]|uniref:Pepco domain-containing protein n=1 Tax=Phormidesmis priestleyi Ana TaxID=1666911 RepID=A0A0P7YTI9_9CYAN|nr:MAG: hypothetical protein HLUCCA11_16895 [Phormidesmis priestleyi Ana]